MFCPYCAKNISNNSAFCTFCGKRIPPQMKRVPLEPPSFFRSNISHGNKSRKKGRRLYIALLIIAGILFTAAMLLLVVSCTNQASEKEQLCETEKTTEGSQKPISTDKLIGDWYFYRQSNDTPTDIVSNLHIDRDGSINMGVGYYATDSCEAVQGTWKYIDFDIGYILHVEGTHIYGEVGNPQSEPYSADLRLTPQGDRLLIENLSEVDSYWEDRQWHERDLDYYKWAEREGINPGF